MNKLIPSFVFSSASERALALENLLWADQYRRMLPHSQSQNRPSTTDCFFFLINVAMISLLI